MNWTIFTVSRLLCNNLFLNRFLVLQARFNDPEKLNWFIFYFTVFIILVSLFNMNHLSMAHVRVQRQLISYHNISCKLFAIVLLNCNSWIRKTRAVRTLINNEFVWDIASLTSLLCGFSIIQCETRRRAFYEGTVSNVMFSHLPRLKRYNAVDKRTKYEREGRSWTDEVIWDNFKHICHIAFK